ncbi:MAG: hypothetical protein U0263_26690 [Polyangiaceae bacterium]
MNQGEFIANGDGEIFVAFSDLKSTDFVQLSRTNLSGVQGEFAVSKVVGAGFHFQAQPGDQSKFEWRIIG